MKSGIKISVFVTVLSALLALVFNACNCSVTELNIGYIGPLSERAVDLGIGPNNAMLLAVEEFNSVNDKIKVNYSFRDDKWEANNTLKAYNSLKSELNLNLLVVSNTDGVIAVNEECLKDNVTVINPLNSDSLLSALPNHVFKIAKKTEEAHEIIGVRMVDLKYKKVAIFHYPNDFMSRATNTVSHLLDKYQVQSLVFSTDKNQTDYTEELLKCQAEKVDAIAFFGYKEYGFAMHQAREMNLNVPFYGSTVLFDPVYYDNSKGALKGTVFTYFTPKDGNYVKAIKFLKSYHDRFGEEPPSIWPAMQAYDAMNIYLRAAKKVLETNASHNDINKLIRQELASLEYYQGVCGNLKMGENNAIQGIYFSLYEYLEKGKVKRSL